jgi:hypothetical protein
MNYEMEIKLNHEFEVMYHTFNDLTKINEELEWIMNLEEKIPMNLITQIRVYKLNTNTIG